MHKYFIIVFLFLYLNVFAQKDIKVLSSTSNSLIIEYSPIYLDTSNLSIHNNSFLNTGLYFGVTHSEDFGVPEIPTRIINIGVPNEFGNTLRVLSSQFDIVNGKIKPVSNFNKFSTSEISDYEIGENYNAYVNPDLVSFGEYGLVRDLRVQSININPIQFDPLKEEIKLYSKIVVQINFSGNDKLNTISKSDLTNDLVVNSNIAKKWGITSKLGKKAAAQNSVLSTGNWYRMEAPVEGMYKIDKSFLESLGIDIADVDPRTIKIYNNGGYILPWTPSSERPNDLIENAIMASGESDGIFDNDDFILFYGRGVDFWEYRNGSDKISRNTHFYSKQNYYWLTYGGEFGKRMETQINLDSPPDHIQKTTEAHKFNDENKQNLMGSGLLYV